MSCNPVQPRSCLFKVLDTILFLSIIGPLVLLLSLIFMDERLRDSTDQASGKRSGLNLYTDHGTGCQYITASSIAELTPRIDKDGNHLGCK